MFAASRRDQEVLRVIGDPVCAALLRSLNDEPRTIPQIGSLIGFPRSSIYRKLRKLERLGLVTVHSSGPAATGGRVSYFRTRFAQITVELRETRLSVILVPRDEAVDRVETLLADLASEAQRRR